MLPKIIKPCGTNNQTMCPFTAYLPDNTKLQMVGSCLIIKNQIGQKWTLLGHRITKSIFKSGCNLIKLKKFQYPVNVQIYRWAGMPNRKNSCGLLHCTLMVRCIITGQLDYFCEI